MKKKRTGNRTPGVQENGRGEAAGNGEGIQEIQLIPAESVRGPDDGAAPVRQRSPTLVRERAQKYFHENFIENDFGHVCNICDRLWFMKDVRRVSEKMVNMLAVEFPYENVKDFMVCAN